MGKGRLSGVYTPGVSYSSVEKSGLIPANPGRRSLTIRAEGANAGTVYLLGKSEGVGSDVSDVSSSNHDEALVAGARVTFTDGLAEVEWGMVATDASDQVRVTEEV